MSNRTTMRNFVVDRREIRDRWDPLSVLYHRQSLGSKYQCYTLGNLLLSRPQYGLSISGTERKTSDQLRLIRITDIGQYGELSAELGKTCDAPIGSCLLEDGDILIARSGNTVGKTFLYRKEIVGYECTFASYLIRLKLDTTKIIPEYFLVYTFLRPYKEWIEATQRAIAQPNINSAEIMKMLICLPPIEVQKQICQAYVQVEKRRIAHQTESSLLLKSIDSEFCKESGIKILPSNTVRSRMVLMREITGRMYSPHLILSQAGWHSEKYPNAFLLEHVQVCRRITIPLSDDTEVSYIPMEDIDQNYGTYEGSRTGRVKNSRGYMTFKEGDLLWARISPCMQNGKSMIAEGLKNGYGYGSTEFLVMESDETLHIKYLLAFLRLKIVREAASFYFSGAAGQQRVDNVFFSQITIPILPREKQNALVEQLQKKQKQSIAERNEAENVIRAFLLETMHTLGLSAD